MSESKKYNACINILSSRTRCIKLCIKSLWDNYNYRYDYPVYVYYFDDIYDSEEFRKEIRESTSQNVHFISIPYETPAHIPQEELFYNRKDLWYARTQFPISRKGYLHMCHFMSNFYGFPVTIPTFMAPTISGRLSKISKKLYGTSFLNNDSSSILKT